MQDSVEALRMVHVIEGRASWRSRTLNTLLRILTSKTLNQGDDLPALRRRYEAIDARHAALDRAAMREAVNCDGVAAQWVSVPESLPGRTVLFLHGGSFAFRFPNAYAAFAARLCKRIGARALIPDYRLAPEHPFPAAPDDCHTVYRWLLAHDFDPRQVVFAGDSAGGNLALVTLQRALQAGEPLPACAVLLSPAVDCTLDSPGLADSECSDPVLRLASVRVLRHHYVPSAQLYTHPHVSPLFGEFAGFPPLLLQVGSAEMLRDQAIRTVQKALAAGVDAELELWPETAHDFQFVPFLPEAALALDQIVKFIVARTGWELLAERTPWSADARP